MGRAGRNRNTFGSGSVAMNLETTCDIIHNTTPPPTIINGIYNFSGNQASLMAQIDRQPIFQQTQKQDTSDLKIPVYQTDDLLPPQLNPVIQPMNMNPSQQQDCLIKEINICLVGNKSKPASMCCYVWTALTGSFCIIPLCFMCCMWWKKIVFPRYELSLQAYRDLAYFIEKTSTAKDLKLTVIDNAFNAQKARIIYECLSRSRIKTLTFVNGALNCNCHQNQADDFRNNMLPIKSLDIVSSIKWGQLVV